MAEGRHEGPLKRYYCDWLRVALAQKYLANYFASQRNGFRYDVTEHATSQHPGETWAGSSEGRGDVEEVSTRSATHTWTIGSVWLTVRRVGEIRP